MFVFVDHYKINPLMPNGHAVAHTNIPMYLKTSCNYCKWGAKLLVWLNTEDLESATLI